MRFTLKRQPIQDMWAVGHSRHATCVTPQFGSAVSSIGTWGTRLALLALVTLLAVGLSLADGNKHKLSKDLKALKGGPEGATVDIIIQFNQTPTDDHHQKVQDKGGILKTKLDFIKAAHYSVPVESLEALADDPDVSYISPDRQVRGSLDYSVPTVNAPIAWTSYGLSGSGIGVAVVDSGVTPVPDLGVPGSKRSRVVYSQSFVAGDSATADLYEHGIHVAGIIGSNGASSSGSNYFVTFRGVAPNANIINLRVLDSTGAGTDSAVIAAIQQAISLQKTYNIRILNLSLGRPVFESYTLDPLCQALEAAWNAGITVVVAAGNYGRDNSLATSGYGTITSPGIDPYVITVGAMKTMGTLTRGDDLIASYSSKGPTLIDHVVKPDLVAPGNRTISLQASTSLLPTTYPANIVPVSYYKSNSTTNDSTAYYRLSGTSMATPMVSGAAALLLEQNPKLGPDQVKARLMKTASKNFPTSSIAIDPVTGVIYISQYDIFTIGAGYLDIAAAVGSTDVSPQSANALSPIAAYNAKKNWVSITVDPKSVWNSSLDWSTSLVWGTNVFVDGASVLWGSSVCWGTNTSTGFSVIWGISVVWGTSAQTTSEAMNVAIEGEN